MNMTNSRRNRTNFYPAGIFYHVAAALPMVSTLLELVLLAQGSTLWSKAFPIHSLGNRRGSQPPLSFSNAEQRLLSISTLFFDQKCPGLNGMHWR